MNVELIGTVIAGLFSVIAVIITNRAGNDRIQAQMQTAQAVTNEQIVELRKQVEKHNSIVERTFKVETIVQMQAETIKDISRKIDDLEKGR